MHVLPPTTNDDDDDDDDVVDGQHWNDLNQDAVGADHQPPAPRPAALSSGGSSSMINRWKQPEMERTGDIGGMEGLRASFAGGHQVAVREASNSIEPLKGRRRDSSKDDDDDNDNDGNIEGNDDAADDAINESAKKGTTIHRRYRSSRWRMIARSLVRSLTKRCH